MIVLKIDPRLRGALAWLDTVTPDRIEVVDTPVAGNGIDGRPSRRSFS
jgi:hypothetical protein